jgi:hypothetical protein
VQDQQPLRTLGALACQAPSTLSPLEAAAQPALSSGSINGAWLLLLPGTGQKQRKGGGSWD